MANSGLPHRLTREQRSQTAAEISIGMKISPEEAVHLAQDIGLFAIAACSECAKAGEPGARQARLSAFLTASTCALILETTEGPEAVEKLWEADPRRVLLQRLGRARRPAGRQ